MVCELVQVMQHLWMHRSNAKSVKEQEGYLAMSIVHRVVVE